MSAPGASALNPLGVQHLKERMSTDAYRENTKRKDNMQTIVSIATGCAAGALGLTGLTGLLFFIVVFFLATLAFAAKLKFQIKKYYTSEMALVESLVGNALTYVMFWTLTYNFVQVF